MQQSDSENTQPAQSDTQGEPAQRPRGSGWDRLQRVALASFGVVGTLALLGLAACPADLANPADYDHPGSASGGDQSGGAGAGPVGGSGGGSTQPGLGVDTTCLTALFAARCGIPGCHKAPATFAAGLDLAAPGVNTRLIDVPATFATADPSAGCMSGAKLIDSSNPGASWLLGKLSTDGTKCGLKMPIGDPPLTADQIACVTKYTQDVAAAKTSGM